jgi:hypothetical protein
MGVHADGSQEMATCVFFFSLAGSFLLAGVVAFDGGEKGELSECALPEIIPSARRGGPGELIIAASSMRML